MTGNQIADYWQRSAQDAFDTATTLMAAKKYHHALFFCHLALEKALKAKVVKATKRAAPPTHNLSQLAKFANINPDPQTKNYLREITSFNLETRYDDYKLQFYKKATQSFSHQWFTITGKLLSWLKSI